VAVVERGAHDRVVRVKLQRTLVGLDRLSTEGGGYLDGMGRGTVEVRGGGTGSRRCLEATK